VSNDKDRKLSVRHNRAQVRVKPIEESQIEEIDDRADLKAARAAIRDVKRNGTIPWTQLKKDLGLV
jgi:hypothetical protein